MQAAGPAVRRRERDLRRAEHGERQREQQVGPRQPGHQRGHQHEALDQVAENPTCDGFEEVLPRAEE